MVFTPNWWSVWKFLRKQNCWQIQTFLLETTPSELAASFSTQYFEFFNKVVMLFALLFVPSVLFNNAVKCYDYIGSVIEGWIWTTGGMILTGENWSMRWSCPSTILCTTNPTWIFVLSSVPTTALNSQNWFKACTWCSGHNDHMCGRVWMLV
jgi:hypothetical protein